MDRDETTQRARPREGDPASSRTAGDTLEDTTTVDAEEEARAVDADLVRELTGSTRSGATERAPMLGPARRVPHDDSASWVPGDPLQTHAGPGWCSALIELLRWEAAATSSPRRAAVLLYELGELYEDELGQPDLALEAYRKSFERFPGLPTNARALVRQLRAHGDFAACLPVLEAELNAISTVERRLAILAERALIRLHQLEDPEGALEDLTRAQKINPDDPVVNDALIEIYRRTGAVRELETLLRRRTRSCSDSQLCSAMLSTVAQLREELARDSDSAATLYRTALNMAPGNLHAVQALLRTARANRDFPAVAKLHESLAELQTGAAAAAAYWAAGRIYRDRLRNVDLALGAMEQARAQAPEDRAILGDLCELYERSKRWDQLSVVLEKLARLTHDSAESAALLCRLGQIKLERQQDAAGAVEAFREAIRLAPNCISPRRMLGRLYVRHERYEDLLALLADELALYSDQRHRAGIAYRIGNILETKLHALERAVVAYEQALAIQPGFRPALRGLGRVYTALGRYEDLVASFERGLGLAHSRDDRLHLLRRISEVWEKDLKDPAAALNSYERLLAIEPAHPTALRALHRLYAVGGRWKDLTGVLKTDADQAMDRWRRVGLLTEAAEIMERHLADADGALAVYLEVLDLAPCHQPALMAAGRLLHQAGRFDELLRLHRRELEHSEDQTHRIWLLMKIGRLLGERLGRSTDAAAAYSEAMTLAAQLARSNQSGTSTVLAAANQLQRIYRELDDPSGMLGALQTLPLPTSGPAQSLHHRRIAEVLQRGNRPALAIEHLRRALDASNDDVALYQLAQIYASIGDRQSLIHLYQLEAVSVQDPCGTMVVYQKLARLWGEADYELERCVEALEHILRAAPTNQCALHQLKIHLVRLEQWERLVGVIERSRAIGEDKDYRVASAMLVAALKMDRLDDLKSAAQDAQEVLERFPTHPEALSLLARHYQTAGDSAGLLQMLGRQLQSAQSGLEQAALLSAAASLHGCRGELNEALQAFRAAAQAMPDYLPAVRGWLRAARELKQGPSIAEALEAEAEASQDQARRVRLWLDAATTWREEGKDEDRAVAAYRRVLALAPRHRGALEALASLIAARKEWPQLVMLLEEQAGGEEDLQQRKHLLARVADLRRSRLGDRAGARRALEEALELSPADHVLLTALAELCRAEGDWATLVQLDTRLLESTADPILLKALHFELGTIWEEKLPDARRAIAGYRRVLELDPSDLGALTRLSALLLNEGDWKGAIHVTKLLIKRDDDRTRIMGYHLRLAHIYAEGFADLKLAMESCRHALALDPGDLQATTLMAQLLSRTQDLRALDAHLVSTLAVHRARLDRDPFRIESYRVLIKVFTWQKSRDPIHVLLSLLAAINASTEEERASVQELRKLAPRLPARAMTPEEIEELLIHPDERGALYRFLVAAEPSLRRIFPVLERSRADSEKVTARSHPKLSEMLGHLRRNAGVVGLQAFIVPGGEEALAVEDTATPTLYVGKQMLEERAPEELLFSLGRMVAHIRLRHMLYARLSLAELGQVVAALLTVTCHSFSPPHAAEELEELQHSMQQAFNRRARQQLEASALELADRTIDPARWRLAMEQSADRIALALCGDPLAAVHSLLREESHASAAEGITTLEQARQTAGPRTCQLLSFAVSEEHLTLRERMGIAVPR